MSRLYYGFKTNLNETCDDYQTPNVDYFAFDNEEKEFHISLSCNGWDDYGIDSNKVLSGRWKGVECCIEDYDGNTVHEYEDITREDIDLILNSRIYEIGIFIPEECEEIYGDKYDVIASDIEVSLDFEDNEYQWNEDSVDVISY